MSFKYYRLIKSNHDKVMNGEVKVWITDSPKCRWYFNKCFNVPITYFINSWLSINPQNGFYYFDNPDEENLKAISIDLLVHQEEDFHEIITANIFQRIKYLLKSW